MKKRRLYGCRYHFLVLACEKDGKYLMLKRNRHKHFTGHRGRWMNIIGFKPQGYPAPLLTKPFFKAATGLNAQKVRYKGVVRMGVSRDEYDAYMLFEVLKWDGELEPEKTWFGTYEWVPKEKVLGKKFRLLHRADRLLFHLMETKRKYLVYLDFSLREDGSIYKGKWFGNEMTPEELKEWDI